MASTTTEPHPYTPFIRAHLIGKDPTEFYHYVKNRIAGEISQAPPAETFFENEQPENILIFTANIANQYCGHTFGQPTTTADRVLAEGILGSRTEGIGFTREEELNQYLGAIVTASAALLSENVYRIAHGQGTAAANVIQAERSLRVLNAVAESGSCAQWDMVYASLKSFFIPPREELKLIYNSRNETGERVIMGMRTVSRMCLESLARNL
jgi:hypothetical protein